MAKDNKDGGEVVESTIDISEIPGEEKAAILLLSLNEEDAAGSFATSSLNRYRGWVVPCTRQRLKPNQSVSGASCLFGRYSKIHQHWYGQ